VTDAPLLGDVIAVLDALYDPRTAQEWDAVGLVTGDPDQPVRRVLFAVDPVDVVIDEAVAWGADLLVTHHPLLLRGVVATTTRRAGQSRPSSVRVALPTRTPMSRGGVSDALAAARYRRRAAAAADRGAGWTRSWFVPPDAVEAVVDAMTAAGGPARRLERAAFAAGLAHSAATGRTRPLASRRHRTVRETRLEMVAPPRCRGRGGLQAVHP
jgi:hypothetical protein